MPIELVPIGQDALKPRPGDFILCHRRGLASSVIRWGERIRFRSGSNWSHTAIFEDENTVIEALTHGVVRSDIAVYRNIEYGIVRMYLQPIDMSQVVAFAQSCVGQKYGFGVIAGIALRFVTPGHGLWFGMNGTEICSGLVAQALCRGWANFPVNPASITPAELAQYYE